MAENQLVHITLSARSVNPAPDHGALAEAMVVEETRPGTFVLLYTDGVGGDAQLAVFEETAHDAVSRASQIAPGLPIEVRPYQPAFAFDDIGGAR